MIRSRSILVAALACAVVALAGCQTSAGGSGTSAGLAVAEQVAVQYATGKFIEGSAASPAERVARAGQVKAVVSALQGVAHGGAQPATVQTLQAAAIARIDSTKLEPSDRLLAITLVTLVANQLDARMHDGVLSPDKVLVVDEVFGWVLNVAAAYGA